MESYIVRVYRRGTTRVETPGDYRLTGIVEDVSEATRKPFHTLGELWLILAARQQQDSEPEPDGRGKQ